MCLPNQRSLARPERIDRKPIRPLSRILALSLIFLAGCAAGTSGTSWFGAASPTPSPTIAAPTPTPSPIASPVAEETNGRAARKNAKQARAASENAAIASKAAANASAAAALASKQAASVANRIEGSGPSNADVSLESSPAAPGAPVGAIGNRATPLASPARAMSDPADSSTARMTPTLSSRPLDSPGTSGDSDPVKAAKLIRDVDRMEQRIDRKNLSGDDSQRDILGQKLLQEANKALADRDSIAAISLATKALTLFEPLPKLADSMTPLIP